MNFKKILKRISIISGFAENVSILIVILKYKMGADVLHMEERADPEAEEWHDSPWQEVFIRRRNVAREYSRGKKALDLCCGIGWTIYAMGEVAEHVTGVDYSDDALRIARSKYSLENIKYILMDATSLDLESNSFDTVVSMEAIEHFTREEGEKLVQEVQRVLVEGGIFVGSTPAVEKRNPLKLYALQLQDPYHLFLYSRSILEDLLGQYFSEVHISVQEVDGLFFICKK